MEKVYLTGTICRQWSRTSTALTRRGASTSARVSRSTAGRSSSSFSLAPAASSRSTASNAVRCILSLLKCLPDVWLGVSISSRTSAPAGQGGGRVVADLGRLTSKHRFQLGRCPIAAHDTQGEGRPLADLRMRICGRTEKYGKQLRILLQFGGIKMRSHRSDCPQCRKLHLDFLLVATGLARRQQRRQRIDHLETAQGTTEVRSQPKRLRPHAAGFDLPLQDVGQPPGQIGVAAQRTVVRAFQRGDQLDGSRQPSAVRILKRLDQRFDVPARRGQPGDQHHESHHDGRRKQDQFQQHRRAGLARCNKAVMIRVVGFRHDCSAA